MVGQVVEDILERVELEGSEAFLGKLVGLKTILNQIPAVAEANDANPKLVGHSPVLLSAPRGKEERASRPIELAPW